MEAIQSTETATQAVMLGESSRVLKRNIGELAVDRKINEDFKSPARKEVKVCHETYLRRELEQWKELMSEQGIRKSVMCSDELDTEQGISIDILKQDQKDFIVNTVDVEEMTEASRKFRQKFDFFVRVNKFLMDLASEKTLLALDKAKQQSIKIRSEAMLCQISRFCPPKD